MDSLLLMLPFILWAALIIIIYPISYASLANLGTPVSMVGAQGQAGFPLCLSVATNPVGNIGLFIHPCKLAT